MTGCGTGVALVLHSGWLAWLHDRREASVTIGTWTGREARALRAASRLSVRAFAERLGVAARTVSKWEAGGAAMTPLPVTQQILDTALEQADPAVRQRFANLVGVPEARTLAPVRAPWDVEAWADDLDRALACLARQEFAAAAVLLARWPTQQVPDEADTAMLSLCGRGLTLLGDLRRDQGALVGPGSAQAAYGQAHQIAVTLGSPRRMAQAELAMAVVAEMRGDLSGAATAYRRLADDERLGRRDQARALLWVGTAVDKLGEHETAATAMTAAVGVFEQVDEAGDWCVGQQKLALAARGAGRLDTALHHIGLATDGMIDQTPLQQVRLHTARGHILLTDTATRTDGQRLLDHAEALAGQHGLGHQVGAIRTIRASIEEYRA
jgi:transcriptional regulator with XRE-family HTH domain